MLLSCLKEWTVSNLACGIYETSQTLTQLCIHAQELQQVLQQFFFILELLKELI